MTISFTGTPSSNGSEPTDLMKILTFEYIGELAKRKEVELMEVPGNGGIPLLVIIIPNAKVEDNKIVSIVPTVPTEGKTNEP